MRYQQSHNRKPEHQYAKIQVFKLEDGDWEKQISNHNDAVPPGDQCPTTKDAWRRKAIPVYRRPSDQWDEITGSPWQWIWYIPKVTTSPTEDPNDNEFPEWITCYWHTQAGRWVVLDPSPAGKAKWIVVQLNEDGTLEDPTLIEYWEGTDPEKCGPIELVNPLVYPCDLSDKKAICCLRPEYDDYAIVNVELGLVTKND